jgi:class 3 adenylate cyclase
VFAFFALFVGALLGSPLRLILSGAIMAGLLSASFEVFYVQGDRGRWLRKMHPVLEISIYTLVIVTILIAVIFTNNLVFGTLDNLISALDRLHITIPAFIALSVLAITVLRVIAYIGGRNLFHLIVGTYHRPVVEQRLFLFLDISGSTALVERLGPLRTRELIGKFFRDVSRPITDHGGDIYRFTGDGLVAVWDFAPGASISGMVKAVDGIADAVSCNADYYQKNFDHIPGYRIGIHGGEIVVCEEGDVKRAIGFYGDNIHIAARLEQKARDVGVDILVSEQVAQRITYTAHRLVEVGKLELKGLGDRVKVYELKPA